MIDRLVMRLEKLLPMFQDVSSSKHLTDLMDETGCILSQLIVQKHIPANGFFLEQAESALADPMPRWDTDLRAFKRRVLLVNYSDAYSDSPRTVLHSKPFDGPEWVVRRSTQATDQADPMVTETKLPSTSVVQTTQWDKDYVQQGQRYAMFVSELLAECTHTKSKSHSLTVETMEVERIRQEALLASLSKKNRLYVFCGRIWEEYRRIQEVLILKGERRRTREGVQIAEAFPIAKANGWPEAQLDDFKHHAKEGIKKGKPWTDFVKGSKGEEIPLEKFLA